MRRTNYPGHGNIRIKKQRSRFMYRLSIKRWSLTILAVGIVSMLTLPSSARMLQPREAISKPAVMNDRGRFEITLFRFIVGRQSLENAVEFAGAGDEVSFSRMSILRNRRTGSQQIFSAGDFTPTRGEAPPNPVRAGNASPRGGLKSGDDVLIGPQIPIFSGELIRGESAALILLSVWEMDGPSELKQSYANALELFTPDMERLTDSVITNSRPSDVTVRDFEWNSGLPPGAIPGMGVFLGDGPLGLGEAKDRPIGMLRQNNRYSFLPKLLILNFDTAMQSAQANDGIIKILYQDDPRLAGEYTLFLKIRQL